MKLDKFCEETQLNIIQWTVLNCRNTTPNVLVKR